MAYSITEDVLFRGSYLIYSLTCEKLTSALIAELVGIKDYENSLTLGNRGSSLSFSQRIDFLIDMKVLSSNEKAKFRTFMEIRNQLMHNIRASSFVECFSFLSKGKDTWIINQYPKVKGISKEEILSFASIELAKEVFNLITKIHSFVIVKEEESKIAPSLQMEINAYEQVMSEIAELIDTRIALRFNDDKSKVFTKVKGIGKEASELIKERFDSLFYEEIKKTKK